MYYGPISWLYCKLAKSYCIYLFWMYFVVFIDQTQNYPATDPLCEYLILWKKTPVLRKVEGNQGGWTAPRWIDLVPMAKNALLETRKIRLETDCCGGNLSVWWLRVNTESMTHSQSINNVRTGPPNRCICSCLLHHLLPVFSSSYQLNYQCNSFQSMICNRAILTTRAVFLMSRWNILLR